MKRKKINYQLLLRRVCLIVLDIVLIIISSLMALLTRFEFDIEQIPEEFLDVLVSYGILMIFVTLSVFAVFRIYSSLWEYAGLEETFKIIGAVVVSSLILAFCVAAILIGGLKRIATVSQIIVPFMAVIYIIFSITLIICNITEIPAAIVTVVKAAFNPSAVTGGVVGSMIVAMQKGVARGIFSNEAGLGSAPIAAAAAQTKEPVRQGLVSMTGTFIDTIIICTMTGLSIVLTGAWQVEGIEGVQVTTYAFQHGLPFPAKFTAFVLMLCLVFFAFTTILGWDYYSERCLEYLTNGHQKKIIVYRWLYILAVFIGPYMTVSAVWTIADIFNGLMAIPNMIALFVLSGVVAKETKAFFNAKKHKM